MDFLSHPPERIKRDCIKTQIACRDCARVAPGWAKLYATAAFKSSLEKSSLRFNCARIIRNIENNNNGLFKIGMQYQFSRVNLTLDLLIKL